jgi:hypothetical protein
MSLSLFLSPLSFKVQLMFFPGWVWWLASIISATLEPEAEGSKFKASLGKSIRLLFKKKGKAKEPGYDSSGRVLA